jgi:protein-L-isoaspartate(D-aspartate) O-methyltransferase
VHVTCAVSDIPYAWIEQTRPGGVIVAPWGTGYGTGWLVRLAVLEDGRAVGRFVGLANYMVMRAQRRSTRFAAHHADEAVRTTTELDPRQVIGVDHAADLAIGAMAPGITPYLVGNDDGTQSLLLADCGDSWATVDHEPGDPKFVVEQYGPRSLWDEVSSAYMWWSAAGSPEADRFGITVTPEGQQVWLDEPRRPVSGCSARSGSRSR